MPQSHTPPDTAKALDHAKAREELAQGSVAEEEKPDSFHNDPPEGSNPNEVIERHRRTVRP